MELKKPIKKTNVSICCSVCGKTRDYDKAVDSGWIGIDEKPFTYLCDDCKKGGHMDNRPNKIKTICHPHKTSGLARKCNQNDLFIVSGGLQCGNCLELVVEHKIIHPENEDYEKE